MNEITNINEIKENITKQLDNATLVTLLQTTFKGLEPAQAKQALLEGMLRGFSFDDFLKKNIYAVPFGKNYSLVTSVDHARKIGMKSGVVGKSAPIFEEQDGKVISCTVTIKRKVGDYVGDFTATVYFGEYNTGRNQWATKPRTMIAKVAEMHALRMACPEELSQSYLEEEYEGDKQKETEAPEVNIQAYKDKLLGTKDEKELKYEWAGLPGPVRLNPEIIAVKDSLKKKYESTPVQ